MNIWTVSATAAIALAVTVADVPAGSPQPKGGTLPVPLRLSAFAVNMSNVAPGSTATIDIHITRWSTAAERQRLIDTAVTKGQNALLRALQKMPKHGRISIPGWTGPDPHNARLGWDLHYASNAGDGAGQRISIATDRYIGLWEARNQPRTVDYPFTLIEIRLDESGRGIGKMAVATKIEFDKVKRQMVLENYASEPVRLNQITINQ